MSLPPKQRLYRLEAFRRDGRLCLIEGTSRVAVREAETGGTADAMAPFAMRVISLTATSARVVLVPTYAVLLDGDDILLNIQVGAGALLQIQEVSGMVAYSGQAQGSSYSTEISVEAGGVLIWQAEPFIISQGARVLRRSNICLAEGASVCLRETLVLGRTGEKAGELKMRTRADDQHGPVLYEDFHLDGSHTLPGILGSSRVMDQVILLGANPPSELPDKTAGQGIERDNASLQNDGDSPAQDAIMRLHRTGAIARCLTQATHESGLETIMQQWSQAVSKQNTPA